VIAGLKAYTELGMPGPRRLGTLQPSPFWISQILGWGTFGLAKYILSGDTYPHATVLLLVGIGAGLSLLLRAAYRGLRRRGASQPVTLAVAVGASFVAANLWLLLYDGFLHWRGLVPFEGWGAYSKAVLNKAPVLLAWSALYLGIKHWQDLQTERERALKATAAAKEAQLQMLRYQLQPHFLFNALNSLRALIGEDSCKAREMVTELSGFLRYSLLPASVADVALGEELASLRQYLAIEQIRFEHALDVTFSIEPAAERYRVPSFLLHPLAENAIKFGVRTSPMPLRLRVSARVAGNGLLIEMANTGAWHSDSDGSPTLTNGTGLGLANVRERLVHRYPGRSRLELTEADGWVRIRIEIFATEESPG
jgi:hypothetical protein